MANSRKRSGRCVVGREIVAGRPGPWIRPVSDREHQEVSEEERRYEDGKDPKILDVVAVPLIRHSPHNYQQENWLLDPGFYWQVKGRVDWAGRQDFVEPMAPLWINIESSHAGLNDRVAQVRADTLRTSLRLIRVDRMTLRVFQPGAAFNNAKRRVQGQFAYGRSDYWLWVTDPVYERRYLTKPDGTHELGESCLTISLGEPHDGYAYKLVAAIIERAHTDKQ